MKHPCLHLLPFHTQTLKRASTLRNFQKLPKGMMPSLEQQGRTELSTEGVNFSRSFQQKVIGFQLKLALNLVFIQLQNELSRQL